MSFLLVVRFLDLSVNLAIVKSNGFRHVKFGLLSLFLVSCAFVLLAFFVAYTLWEGIWIFVSCLSGYYFFKQTLKHIGYWNCFNICFNTYITI